MSGEKTITIVGWGNQARAWAANLSDSGYRVNVWLRPDSSSKTKAAQVAHVLETDERIPQGPIVFLVPDDQIPQALGRLATRLIPGSLLLYAHGYALETEKLHERHPSFRHALLAPKAIGTEVRATYVDKRPLGGVYSVEHAHDAEEKILTLAKDLGITMGPYPCTFKQEMVADLFSEQAVLCSVIPESCRLAFDMLRARGIPPELAFFELWHEVGLIVKTMVDKGPEAFFNLISPNALIGAEKGRQLLCGEDFKKRLQTLLNEIEDGSFKKTVDQTDPAKTREETLKRWTTSELNQTINRMKT